MEITAPSVPFMIIIFLLVITILVFVHEMGHYLVARACGVKVTSFSIGFGREVFGWNDRHGTRWKISAIPLGGYVKFFGDASIASNPQEMGKELTEEERNGAFHLKPLYQRAAIVAAGPLINYLFAVVIFAGFFAFLGYSPTPPVIESVAAQSPAQTAGLQAGDRILAIDGKKISDFSEIGRYVVVRPDETIELGISRNGTEISIPVDIARVEEEDQFGNKIEKGQLGIAALVADRKEPNLLESITLALEQVWDLQVVMLNGLKRVIFGSLSMDQLAGPLKMAKFSGEAAAVSTLNLVRFTAIISISLGFMNLLPIPMLDGGHLAFYACEAVRGRPVSARIQEYATLAGLACVLFFFVLVTMNDLDSFGVWDRISNLFS